MSDLRTRLAAASRPLIVAHRGVWSDAPENSLAAIHAARDYDMVEIDVRLSSDGIPVVMHDATLERTAGQSTAVRDITADDLGQVKLLGCDETIATVETALATGGDALLYDLDVKDEAEIEGVAAHVAQHPKAKDCMLKMTVTTIADFDALSSVEERFGIAVIAKMRLATDADVRLVEQMHARGVAGAEVNFASLDILQRAKATGLPLTTYTLNDVHCCGLSDAAGLLDPAAVWGTLAQTGLSAIMTDEPARLAAFLNDTPPT